MSHHFSPADRKQRTGPMNALPPVAAIKESLSKNGYYALKDFDRCQLLYLANELGTPKVDPRHPYPIRPLSPQPIEKANPNTLSSRYGLSSFPFHTDAAHWRTPAQILLLYCVQPGSGHRKTYLIDFLQWKLSDGDRHLLCTSIWRSRHLKAFLCTAMESEDNSPRIRYDPGCMMPFSESANDARVILQRSIESSSLIQIDWSEKKLLILNNTRILHARGASLVPDTDRVLERILIGGYYDNVGFQATVDEG